MAALLISMVLVQIAPEARAATAMELIAEPPPTAFCDSGRSPLLSVETLCAAKPTSVRTERWRLPKKDETWTVRVDAVRFSSSERAAEQFERLRELMRHVSALRADGRRAPSLSWCEASYVLRDDAIVMSTVSCGATRPWCTVTRELLRAAGPKGRAIVGAIGGSAHLADTPDAVCPAKEPARGQPQPAKTP